jgi:hypothetical protein
LGSPVQPTKPRVIEAVTFWILRYLLQLSHLKFTLRALEIKLGTTKPQPLSVKNTMTVCLLFLMIYLFVAFCKTDTYTHPLTLTLLFWRHSSCFCCCPEDMQP